VGEGYGGREGALLSARRGESLAHVYPGRGNAEADAQCEHWSYVNIPSGNIPSGALGVSTSHHQPQCGEVRRRGLQPTECPASDRHNTGRPLVKSRGIRGDGCDAHVRLVHGDAAHRGREGSEH
jgi:hypothetical protein